MTHQPQQILVRVDCKERLPKMAGYYQCVVKEQDDWIYFNHVTEYWYYSEYEIISAFPTHWYEPATRIVLTVEEMKTIQNKINLLAADNGRLMNKLSQLTNHHP